MDAPLTRLYPAEHQRLQNGLNGRIDGEVCYGFTADEVGFTRDVGEMQVAAEVVILVEHAEEHLDFRGA